MASEILGLFASPQQYQQQQQDLARSRAMEYAKLDPFARAETAIGQGAYGLAGAIGGALGGVDPQLQKITQRQQLASQLDPSNPQSYMQVAQMAADAGDQQFAMAIADAGRQAAIQVAQANKERQATIPARIQEAQQAASITQAIDMYKAMPQTPEIQKAIKTLEVQLDFLSPKTKAEATPNEIQIARTFALRKGAEGSPEFNTEFDAQLTRLTTKEPKEKNIAFGTEAERKSKSMFGKSYADLTPDEAGKVDKAVEVSEQAKATKVNVGVDVKGQEAGAVESAKLDAKRLDEARTSSAKAQDQKQILATMQQALPSIVSGTGAQARTSFLNLLQTVGLASPEDQNKLASSELFNSLAGERVLSFIKTLGTNPTDTDREFARTIGPALEKGTKSNKDLIDYLSKRADSIINNASLMEQHYFDNKYSLRGFKQRNDVIPIPTSSQGGWSIKKKP